MRAGAAIDGVSECVADNADPNADADPHADRVADIITGGQIDSDREGVGQRDRRDDGQPHGVGVTDGHADPHAGV